MNSFEKCLLAVFVGEVFNSGFDGGGIIGNITGANHNELMADIGLRDFLLVRLDRLGFSGEDGALAGGGMILLGFIFFLVDGLEGRGSDISLLFVVLDIFLFQEVIDFLVFYGFMFLFSFHL